MHRHGYKGRKFGRETDQRTALLRGLMCSLILEHSITTTIAKAKEMRRHTEKLITLAKKGGLANRRLVISRLNSISTGNYLMDVVAPSVKRDSGYLRIERAGFRKGDNAELATISFVDKIEMPKVEKVEKTETKKSTEAKTAPKKEEK